MFLFLVGQVEPVTSRQNCKWEWKMAATPLSQSHAPPLGVAGRMGGVRWVEVFFGLEALHTEQRENSG